MSSGTERGGRTPALFFSLVAVATLLLAPAAGATDKCGEVGGETWTLADSPYVITCDVTVAAGTTLMIEAGVEARFQAATGMYVDGTLNVNGTVSDIVTLTSDESFQQAGDWSGVNFLLDATGNVNHALLDYSDYGVTVNDDATVTLTGVTSSRNWYGLFVKGSGNPSVHAVDSKFIYNSHYGVMIQLTAPDRYSTPITITASELHSNGIRDLTCFESLAQPPVLVMARGNWWGTTDASAIADSFRENRVSNLHPIVDFCGFLNSDGLPHRDVHCPDLIVDPDETEVWDQTLKPYLVTSNVEAHGALQIGPGVEVRVVPSVNIARIAALGDTTFNSTVGAPALFTSDSATPQPGQWCSFHALDSMTIRNAIFEYASQGVTTYGWDTTLENVTAQQNLWGLFIGAFSNETVTVTDSTVTNNLNYGVWVEELSEDSSPSFSITNSSIHDNGEHDFYVGEFTNPEKMSLVAHYNWWGTDSTIGIQDAIFDHEDESTRPKVDWCGHLSGEGAPPVYDMYCPDLYVCGETVTLNQTLKPYLLTSDLDICSDGILQIEEGVEIRAAEYTPPEHIYVAGTLGVNGSVASPVTFESNASSPQAGDWAGIYFHAGGIGDLQHAAIRHADAGVVASGASHIVLHEVDSRMNQDGLYVGGSGPPEVTATNCTFADNTRNGVTVSRVDGYANPVVTVNYSSLYNNGNYEYYADAFNDPAETRLDANLNWWGTTETATIAAGIHDHSDSTTSPIVDWCAYLDAENGAGRDVYCPAALDICGENHLWDQTGKPYLIVSDLHVCPGWTLEMAEGIEVRFADTGTPLDFLVEGTLITSGAELNPVTLTSDAAAPAAQDWSGVRLENGGSATLNHTTIAYGSDGIKVGNSASATLDGVTATENQNGLYAYGTGTPTVTATNSSFVQNDLYGVNLVGQAGEPDPSVTINSSSLHSNGPDYDLHTDSFSTPDLTVVDVRDNWWGNVETELIGPRIYDHRASPSTSPRVDWCGYLNGPGGTPEVDSYCPDLVICDETADWNLTGKPYLLTTDLWVCPTTGTTLEIESGVLVETVKLATNKPEFLVE